MSANERQVAGDHYKSEFQHWDICARNGIGYLESCASKYATRCFKKNGAVDVEKGVHYCDKILDLIDEINYRPSGIVKKIDLERFFAANEITDTHQIAAITYLLRWDNRNDIWMARRNMQELLKKAQATG